MSRTSIPNSKACADWRWIGIKGPRVAKCPDVPGWKVSPLFAPEVSGQAQETHEQQQRPDDRQQSLDKKVPGKVSSLLISDVSSQAQETHEQEQRSDTGQESLDEKVPEKLSSSEAIRKLNSFCLYELEGPNLPPPPTVGEELIRVDQDCAAISPEADRDMSRANWKDVSKHFLSQAGRTPLDINNLRGVRLSFLDTQPTGVGVPRKPGSSMHGYTLAHIAQHLVCSPEKSDRCAAQITTRLALPFMRFDAGNQALSEMDPTRGGHIGMQSDLAKAIWSEVEDWLGDCQCKNSRQHLVLNLSLAWDPKLIQDLDSAQIDAMKAGTQAVYSALQYARSLDVLVLAATGNQKECPLQTEGPLLPAAWEREVALGNTPKAPLVYAVGGVQSNGRPLTNARAKGIPQRVTYAENAIVSTGDPMPRRIYTGSSIATAVASSIAAVVWDSFPRLTSDEVMKVLDASGDELTIPDANGNPLPFKADFWFSAGAPPVLKAAPTVHRLSLCTALKAACGQRPFDHCPLQSYSCVPWVPTQAIFPAWAASPPLSKICQPWVLSQPDDPPCPNPGCHSG